MTWGNHVIAPMSHLSYDPRSKFWQSSQSWLIYVAPSPPWAALLWTPVDCLPLCSIIIFRLTLLRWSICHVICDPITWLLPVSGSLLLVWIAHPLRRRKDMNSPCEDDVTVWRRCYVAVSPALFVVDKQALSVDDRWWPHQESLLTHHHCFVTFYLRQTGK